METRQVTQVKIFKLVLNRMTVSKIEYTEIVAVAYDRQELIDWVEGEKNPDGAWEDGRWIKTFKQGSQLEWFNSCSYDSLSTYGGAGIQEEWVNQEVFDNFKLNNPDILVVKHTMV